MVNTGPSRSARRNAFSNVFSVNLHRNIALYFLSRIRLTQVKFDQPLHHRAVESGRSGRMNIGCLFLTTTNVCSLPKRDWLSERTNGIGTERYVCEQNNQVLDLSTLHI